MTDLIRTGDLAHPPGHFLSESGALVDEAAGYLLHLTYGLPRRTWVVLDVDRYFGDVIGACKAINDYEWPLEHTHLAITILDDDDWRLLVCRMLG